MSRPPPAVQKDKKDKENKENKENKEKDKRARAQSVSTSSSSLSSSDFEESNTKRPRVESKRFGVASASSSSSSSAHSESRGMASSSSGAAAKKKMVIKPFKVTPKPPASFEEDTFAKLAAAVEAVFARRSVDSSQEDLYRSVESLCLHKKAAQLYEKVHAACDAHIVLIISKLAAATGDPLTFLTLVESEWRDHCDQLLIIRGIFLYLDRTYVISNVRARSLWDMGLQLFSQHLRGSVALENKIVTGLLLLIEKERMGESINKSLVKKLRLMYSALRLYKRSFEKHLIEQSTTFYEAEGARLVAEMTVPDYLTHVQRRLQQEMSRVDDYLDETSRAPLVALVELHLIKSHVEAVLKKGFEKLMHECRRDELALMFSLVTRVGAQPLLLDAFCAYIKRAGAEIVMPEDKDAEMVKNLLAFKASLDDLVRHSFGNEEEFVYGLKKSFEAFINDRENKPAELIAKFVDAKLKSSKGSTEEELDQVLNKVMVLFRYIHGKDVFQAFYKKDLARRLLLGKSASVDAEKSMIAKIKAECGASFTAKLENMFKDIELSREIQRDFDAHVKKLTSPPSLEFGIQVLTTSSWPQVSPVPLHLPKEVGLLYDEFRTQYLGKHTGRKLTWDNSKATCILRAHFPKGKRELAVSGHQAVALLLFNSTRTISFADIKLGTGLEEAECRRTLQSLACGKVKVLNKKPSGPKVGVEDQFQVNMAFKHTLLRIKINSIQMKESKEETKSTTKRIFADRQFALDALIVRIMKSRKMLPHAQLMAEVYTQLKFPAKAAEIKKRIASLIERDYMERDEENSTVYKYQA